MVYELRPALETVLTCERVLRRGQPCRRVGGPQRVEMFLGLLAELIERWTFRQTPAKGNRYDDLLSNAARVRSTG